ncbi:guanylate kinase [Agrobacterium sp. SHOUNA12C]|uniref:Guanylate kinase n=2 Tax=Rhizobium rhizogenes TaxID=359 RepID=B9JCD0_RHIR8|nr:MULTISPECIES: guanylate kinase [Rhizobium]ACM26051.1 guanylate kinase (GMP kinase) protein [Rhizobium rhizogenes K84]KAA6491128.1 guanylate kinase [Agrobacterium sp. ICMP 7243]MCJ9721669.1 guanylate kinase [Agrobacterium sp. BETTINA12B]MCJ9759530.1 guanylate kinase [Agrobacterium sp. SHOUNA12C]OCJ06585.1 guanylate kinase [Agrobacterium sp. 13-626]OCJ25148.1 guanylate kinase [Agrobacterium sp. B131/95]OCJ31696.1 guanylate kinase [Agrobacterium sp. B133/95]
MKPVISTSIPIARRGLMLAISSPSGAGKSTIARTLLDTDKHVGLSVSVTTRQRRPSEIAGVHYHFVSQREFERLRDSDSLLEWAEVHGNFYGTPREPVETAMAEGRDMLFDIDWQGAQQLQEKMPADVVSIFVLPPTMTELQSRLHRRAEDSEEVIATRLANSRSEIAHWREYDYVIINDDLNAAFDAVQSIVKAERLRRDRRHGMFDFVRGLLEETPKL